MLTFFYDLWTFRSTYYRILLLFLDFPRKLGKFWNHNFVMNCRELTFESMILLDQNVDFFYDLCGLFGQLSWFFCFIYFPNRLGKFWHHNIVLNCWALQFIKFLCQIEYTGKTGKWPPVRRISIFNF